MAEQFDRRRFGDRRDGRLLRSLGPSYKLSPYVSGRRSDAGCCFSDSVEVTEVESWLREKRQSWNGMGMLHLFLAAYARLVAGCPGMNRFVSGQKIFARNSLDVVLLVRRTETAAAEDIRVKVGLDSTDTIYDVYRKLGEKVDDLQASEGLRGPDRSAEALANLPGPLLKFGAWFLNLLDYFGWLPRPLLEESTYHGSLIISDMGSLGMGPVYRHLYNFGNVPLFVTLGVKRRAVETETVGLPVERHYVDYKVVWDDRIVDSAYFANAMKYLKYYLENPALLEDPPQRVLQDIF